MLINHVQVNGSACSQNSNLINGILKDELGFQGFVMSDWLAHMSGVGSALAGLDLDMPGDTQVPFLGYSYWMFELTRSALNGSVPMDRINDMATRIVATWYHMGQDQDYPATNFHTTSRAREGFLYPAAFPASPYGVINENIEVQADHDVVARQVAQEAITLLKNDDRLLPLYDKRPITVFGTDAAKNPDPNGCLDRNCNKGTLGQGWGSGTVDYMYLDDPITALRARVGNVTFHNSDTIPLFLPKPSDQDIAIVFISSDSGENGYVVEGNHGDRDASKLSAWHGGDKLVEEVAKRYKNVVVVAHTVGPLILEQWIDMPSVKSVLIAHLPGQEAGRSLVEVLYGDVSPSGHLPYSITREEDDMPKSVTDLIDFAIFNQPDDDYTEGLHIDYRWLNKQKIKPRYAFGHGLSYAKFNFSDASIAKTMSLSQTPPERSAKTGILDYSQNIPNATEGVKPDGFPKIFRFIYSWLQKWEAEAAVKDAATKKYPYPDGYATTQKAGPRAGGGQGGNPALWDVAYKLSVKVSSTGANSTGKASAQAYLQFPDDAGYETPIIQLRDFAKTKTLFPGQSETVELQLTRKDLSVWDATIQDWVVPKVDGAYRVWIGDASDNLHTVCRTDTLQCQSGVQGPV